MIGLRTFLKDFADTTGLVPFDTLYERQRALVRCGLLTSVKGRGPGTGTPLNAETLAIFLVSVLATDRLSEIGDRTEALCRALQIMHQDEKGKYRLGKSNFAFGVTQALLQRPIAGLAKTKGPYLGIQATRPWRGIILRDRGLATSGQVNVEYFAEVEAPVDLSFTMQTISIEGQVFSWLSSRLWDYLEYQLPVKRREL